MAEHGAPPVCYRGPVHRLTFIAILVLSVVFQLVTIDLKSAAEETPDTSSYLAASRLPLTSPAFWAGSRPPGFPLALKLVGQDLYKLELLHIVCSCAAWTFLAWAAAVGLQSLTAWRVAVLALAGMAATYPVLIWNSLALSESLALSSQAAVAGIVILMTKWAFGIAQGPEGVLARILLWSTAAAVTLGSCMVRDTGLFGLLALVGYWAILGWKGPQKRSALLAITVILLMLCVLSAAQTAAANRGLTEVANVLLERVLPDPTHQAWLIEHTGLPMSDCVRARLGKSFYADNYAAARCLEFIRWRDQFGRRAYQSYLLHHLPETLYEAYRAGNANMNKDLKMYARKTDRLRASSLLRGVVFPFLPLPSLLLLGLVLWGLLERIQPTVSSAMILAAGGLAASALAQLYVGYHGDTGEIGRHIRSATVLTRVVLWLAVAAMIERRSTRASQKIGKWTLKQEPAPGAVSTSISPS